LPNVAWRVRTRSQALVEFALSISVFMLLILGTFDLARAYVAYTVVSNAAREAARYGAAHSGDVDWQTQATQAGFNLAVGIDPAALQLTPGTLTQTYGTVSLTYINVTGSYRFQSLTPMVGALLGNPITIRVDTSVLAG
jgi:Flp pilus assembly protein TadG